MKLAAICIVLFTQIGCQQTSPIPAEIVGDSMAPLLCGRRNSQACPRCRMAFEHSVSQKLETVYCPNCGKKFTPSSSRIKADRVAVIPNQTPLRWDIVALEHGDDKTLIKRVIGLPGESVAIFNGEVFVDDELIRKPDEIVQQTKRFVFDSSFTCPQILATLEHDDEFWENQEGVLAHTAGVGDEVDWIAYRHQSTSANHEISQSITYPPITDDDEFNQNFSRRLNVVGDLIVQTDVTLSANAEFHLVRVCHGTVYEVTITVDENLEGCDIRLVFRDEEMSFRSACSGEYGQEIPISILLSNIDQKIKLIVDGETIFEIPQWAVEFNEPEQRDGKQPYFKFGLSRQSKGRLNRCRIWRDIHYFAEVGAAKFSLPMKLGPGEYFVVGDNVPVSRDSRHFGPVTNIIGIIDPTSKSMPDNIR